MRWLSKRTRTVSPRPPGSESRTSGGRRLGVVSGGGQPTQEEANMARSVSRAPWDRWTYRGDVGGDRGHLMGLDVEAAHGHIGKIDDARPTAGSAARPRDGS